MTLEEDVRRCCDDIEGVHENAQRVRESGAEEAKQHLAKFDSKFEQFLSNAQDVRRKLDAGIREGFEGLVEAWRDARDRLRGHLGLIEAKSNLASAQRLAKDQYYVAAESALTTALRQAQEARALLGSEDAHLNELVEKIERVVEDVREQGQATAERLEGVVTTNERLLEELETEAETERR